MIHCLYVSGISLNGEARFELYRTSVEMFLENKKHRTIKGETFKGEIHSKFRRGILCGICGTVFFATIETSLGKGEVSFIVDTRNLIVEEKGVWVKGTFPGSMPTPPYMN